ncbi:MAG TPA: hypothetical protein VMS89_04650 [Methanoregulaceae archaeon]|nr:hypothetical protein [Methanoregulaceae archaeon]
MFRAAGNPLPEDVKICPVISNGHDVILCQRSNCYAAYPVRLMGETCWFCAIIDGPGKIRNQSSGIIVR